MNMRDDMNAKREWVDFVRTCVVGADGLQTTPEEQVEWFANEQWELYWAGVRDGRLADCAIWLIDRYGYAKAV